MAAPTIPSTASDAFRDLQAQGFYKKSAPKPENTDADSNNLAGPLPPIPEPRRKRKRKERGKKRKRVVASPVAQFPEQEEEEQEEEPQEQHPLYVGCLDDDDDDNDGDGGETKEEVFEEKKEDKDKAKVERGLITVSGPEKEDSQPEQQEQEKGVVAVKEREQTRQQQTQQQQQTQEVKQDAPPVQVQAQKSKSESAKPRVKLVLHGEAASALKKAARDQEAQIKAKGEYPNHPDVDKLIYRASVAPKTPQWFRKRYDIVTGTQIAKLATGGRTAKQLKKEKSFKVPRRDLSNIPAIMHGTRNENKASAWFTSLTGITLVPSNMGLFVDEARQIGATPDFIAKYIPWLLEVKCPFSRVPNGKVPKNYVWQMWQQMFVTGIHQCFFIEYVAPSVATPENPPALHVNVVRFDKVAQATYNRVLRLVGPFMRDAIVLRDGRTEPPEEEDDKARVLSAEEAQKVAYMFD